MANQSKIQIAPDSSGKNLNTLVTQVNINGVTTDVQCQVVALVNRDGELIDPREIINLLSDVLIELRRLRIAKSLSLGIDLENLNLKEQGGK